MQIKDFYEFGGKLLGTTIQAPPINLTKPRDNGNLFEAHHLIMGNYKNFKFPIIFQHKYGKNFCDILDTGFGSLYLISDRLKQLFQKYNFTGWNTFPIKLLGKKGDEISGYHGLSIIGRCGAIDNKKSKIVERQFIENGPMWKYYLGLHIGLDEWDGSDFFLPKNNFGIIVTSRVEEALKKEKLTNLRFRNLSEIEQSVEMN